MFARGIGIAAAALVLAAPCIAGTQTRTSAFEYDPTSGLLIREIIEPDNSALCVVTTYIYDNGLANGVGNKTSATTRNCNGTTSGGVTEAAAPTGDPVFSSRTSGTGYGATLANPVPGQFPTSSTNALSHGEQRTFDARFGGVTSLTGPNNLRTDWTYDSFGRKKNETRADTTVTSWSYERCADLAANICPPFGQYRVRVTATGAPASSTYYDSLNREIRTETQGFDGTLVMKDTQYDSLGRVAQVSRPYYSAAPQYWTVFTTYDILGRVAQVDEPVTASGQVRTVTAYNALITTVTVSNAGAGTGLPANVTQSKTTTKNSQGQVVQVKDTQNNLLTYVYDEFGNLKTTTDALGNVTTLSYDTRGRKTQMIDPDMGTWSYFYDALGELIRQTDAKSQTASMVYDLLGRMTSRTEPDLVSSWTYDNCAMGIGKLCSASATNGYSRTVGYDSLGRPATLNASIDIAYSVATSYDTSGRVDTVTYPTGFAVKNSYNSFGYLSQVQRADAGGSTVFWHANTRSASGLVTSELLGNGLTQTRTPDVLDRLSSIVASGASGTVHSLSYTYDTIGNVTQRVDNVDAVTENFTYDNLNRLTMASGPNLVTRSFSYNDALGNITYKSDAGTYTYNPSGAGSVRPHAVTNVTNAGAPNSLTVAYSYDANGNLTGASGTLYPATGSVAFSRTLTYMSFNLPATINQTQGTNTYAYTYTYSPEHERARLVTQRPDGTFTSIYLHPGGKGSLLYEKEIRQSDGRLQHKHYVQAGALLVGVYVTQSSYATGEAPGMRYYHLDHLGSIALITNESAGVMERLAYEAFGERRYPSGTPEDRSSPLFGITTDRGFTGHEHLDELMLIHMNGRVYDPLLGRFMTPDPFVQASDNLQSYNRYSYVWNNPLGAIDPTGFSRWTRFRNSITNWVRADVKAMFEPTLKNKFDAIHAHPGMGTVDNFVLTHPWAYQIGEIAAATYGGAVGGAAFATYFSYEATGSVNAGLKAGAISLGTAMAFYAVGNVSDAGSLGNVLGHAAVGCASSAASGGSCRSGALSAALPAAIGEIKGLDFAGNLVAQSVIGGTASVLGGGSFANGAKTAAFGYLFNAYMHNESRATLTNENVEIAAKKLNDLIVARGYNEEDFLVEVTGGDRYVDRNGKHREWATGQIVPDSDANSAHLIVNGARDVDVVVRGIPVEVIRGVYQEAGFTRIDTSYPDGHIHLGLPRNQGIVVFRPSGQ